LIDKNSLKIDTNNNKLNNSYFVYKQIWEEYLSKNIMKC